MERIPASNDFLINFTLLNVDKLRSMTPSCFDVPAFEMVSFSRFAQTRAEGSRDPSGLLTAAEVSPAAVFRTTLTICRMRRLG
jgi:hypothetical protein